MLKKLLSILMTIVMFIPNLVMGLAKTIPNPDRIIGDWYVGPAMGTITKLKENEYEFVDSSGVYSTIVFTYNPVTLKYVGAPEPMEGLDDMMLTMFITAQSSKSAQIGGIVSSTIDPPMFPPQAMEFTPLFRTLADAEAFRDAEFVKLVTKSVGTYTYDNGTKSLKISIVNGKGYATIMGGSPLLLDSLFIGFSTLLSSTGDRYFDIYPKEDNDTMMDIEEYDANDNLLNSYTATKQVIV
jgi:hypothetical protein